MTKYDTEKALAEKIVWEGGVQDFIKYGVSEFDLPDDLPRHVRRAFQALIDPETRDHIRTIDEWVEEVLEDG